MQFLSTQAGQTFLGGMLLLLALIAVSQRWFWFAGFMAVCSLIPFLIAHPPHTTRGKAISDAEKNVEVAKSNLAILKRNAAIRQAEYHKELAKWMNDSHGSVWWPSERRGMALTIGAARSGKLVSTIAPGLLTWSGPAVCLDVKGELAWITAARRRQMGQRVAILDPFGMVNEHYAEKFGVAERIAKYNPLAHLKPESMDFPEELAAIGEAMLLDDNSKAENASFFASAARELFIGLVAACVQKNPGKATLRHVREFLTLDPESFAAACAGICQTYPGSIAAKKLAQFVKVNKTNDGVRDTAKDQTKALDSEILLRAMEPGPQDEVFSFQELTGAAPVTVYIVLPPWELHNHSRWMRLLIMQAMRIVLRSRRPATVPPVVFLLDEAGTALGHLSVVEQAYGLNSGLGVIVWAFYQDLSQIKRDYPSSWQTFIANSVVIQIIKAADNETLNYFSEHMGKTTVPTRTENEGSSQGENMGSNASGGGSVGSSWGNNSGVSFGETGRPLMFPDEIRNIPDNRLLILFRGEAPKLLYQLRYYTDERFATWRRDPHYMTPAQIEAYKAQAAANDNLAAMDRQSDAAAAATAAEAAANDKDAPPTKQAANA